MSVQQSNQMFLFSAHSHACTLKHSSEELLNSENFVCSYVSVENCDSGSTGNKNMATPTSLNYCIFQKKLEKKTTHTTDSFLTFLTVQS